jgi:F-type H+-transporting ATPase subunit b
MTIDWWTLVLQAINFLVLVWLLWRFLYRPVKEVIEKRKALAEQAFADAEKKKGEAEAARQRFDADRAKLAQERQDMLKKIHEDLEAERRNVLEAAKRDADKELAAARQALAEERDAALTEVREQVSGLAVELASGLLRKAGSGAAAGAFLDALDRQLKDMPAEERERLQKDLAADGAKLTVVTAAALTPDEQDRWRKRLNSRLGQKDKTDFATDPEILGGAELRFPHAVVKLTWADQLRKAEELLRRDEAAS